MNRSGNRPPIPNFYTPPNRGIQKCDSVGFSMENNQGLRGGADHNIPLVNFSGTRNDSQNDISPENLDDMDRESLCPTPNSRIHSIHRNSNYSSQGRTINRVRDARTGGPHSLSVNAVDANMVENHANLIVSKMEQDAALMEDSPASEELRKEALRDMPQCLTIKKCVRIKLTKSVSQKSKTKRIGCFKTFKYKMSRFFSNIKNDIKSLTYFFELWYGSLKKIEGNFGSGVASFFKFLRWLFLLNLFIAICSVSFIVVPQITFDNQTNNSPSEKFSFQDIFTGEGYFTSTVLFYGAYSNSFVSSSSLSYSMPDAYFFTILAIFLICFAVLSVSVARSYKKSYIETEGGLKNVYAHKIFCGWDYSIATSDAATLKSSSIYHELQELLYESNKTKRKSSCLSLFGTIAMQLSMNVIVMSLLAITGWVMWLLLKSTEGGQQSSIVTSVVMNIVMTIYPILFSFIIRYEDYKNPRTVLGLTLLRTFLLGFVIIGVSVTYWIKTSNPKVCWETSLGQEVYRLILFDFIFSVLISALFDGILFLTYRFFKRGFLEFDIARHTVQLIYNQTLFWVGFFFSPVLAIIVVVKLFLTWYFREFMALKLCKPSAKSWRAAQTQTWFLMMAFLSLLLVGGVFGYIIVYIKTSNCGPFRHYDYIYEIVTLGVLQLEKDSTFLKYLLYVVKPGFVAMIIMALCVRVYYLRAKAHAQLGVVAIYREMLVWESKDKEFLLQYISQVTKGQWQYKLQDSREIDPVNSPPDITLHNRHEGGDTRKFSEAPFSLMHPVSVISTSSLTPSTSQSTDSNLDSSLYTRFKKYA